MKKVTIALALLAITAGVNNQAIAQSKKDKKKTDAAPKQESSATQTVSKVSAKGTNAAGNDGGYIKLEAGTDYKIIVDAPGDVYPDYGDYMEIHLNAVGSDSIIFDTRSAMDGQPAPLQLQQSPFRGDLMEALRKMTQGDSAQVRLSVDSLLSAGAPEAPWMKKGVGQKLVYNLQIVKVTPKALKQKEDEANAAKQIGIDEKLIQDYLTKNNIKATKTASGMYYKVERAGTGANAEAGKKVSVNYTGMLLNGEKFDSNVDPQFQHVEPFQFMLGAGNVIKGWDEGIALLKKGGKATLYIPSSLAYGKNSPSPKIPANSVLVFEVELIDIIEKQDDAKLLQEYLTKNNIKATKTASGLYYKIDRQGTGDNPKVGQKVSVNYTGMLLNGEKFDSNVDPQFQHVQPFEFNLGTGAVIKGWDEGIALLKKGGKGTLYIPANLAYGENSPSPKIPANSVLMFEVELININTGN